MGRGSRHSTEQQVFSIWLPGGEPALETPVQSLPGRQRLRELALERYLTDIDDGWVIRQARTYRGRTQIEDEEALGRNLLLELLADAVWVRNNFLLAREAVRVIPHVGDANDIARLVRRNAIEVVNRDASFESLRAEIHGAPSGATAARVRAWAIGKPEELAAFARQLAAELELLYSLEGRRDRLVSHRVGLALDPNLQPLAARLSFDGSDTAVNRLAELASLAAEFRAVIEAAETLGRTRLRLFDILIDLEGELGVTLIEALASASHSRLALLTLAGHAAVAAHGTGMLTAHEAEVLDRSLQRATALDETALPLYAAAIDELRRAPHWAAGSIRHAFAEPLIRYTALDARAAGFVDDLMRGSVLVGLGEVARRLAIDLGALTGVVQLINGQEGLPAFGLNAGVARGNLKIFATDEALRAGQLTAADIVLIPETTPELAQTASHLSGIAGVDPAHEP
jgi:hypothetical protein